MAFSLRWLVGRPYPSDGTRMWGTIVNDCHIAVLSWHKKRTLEDFQSFFQSICDAGLPAMWDEENPAEHDEYHWRQEYAAKSMGSACISFSAKNVIAETGAPAAKEFSSSRYSVSLLYHYEGRL